MEAAVNSPVLGDDGRVLYLLHRVEDLTEQVRANEQLQSMSTPVVMVRDRILLLPLIGEVDGRRSGQVTDAVLARVAEEDAKAVIIDVAGVPVMDTLVAESLLQLAKSVGLLGARTILTGISAHTARTMVHLGIDTAGLETRARLSEGIDLALRLTAKPGSPPRAESA